MDLLDALASPPPRKDSFTDWLDGVQDDKLRKALDVAAVDPRWSNYALMNLLRERGARCSIQAIKKWRNSLGYTGD